MIYPIFEFGSFVFIILFVIFCLAEMTFFYVGGAEIHTIVIAAVAAMVIFGGTGGLPEFSWWYPLIYFGGAVIWVPVYWYLMLRKNRNQLIKCNQNTGLNQGHEQYGIRKDGVWLPKHPENSALVANGLVWFLAAPIHMTENWINLIIDTLTGLMNKVQKSMAVTPPEKK